MSKQQLKKIETMVQDGFATVEQAKAFLNISRASIYAMLAKKQIASVKFGKSRRIPWGALREFATEAMAKA